jgi:hypothetical protein
VTFLPQKRRKRRKGEEEKKKKKEEKAKEKLLKKFLFESLQNVSMVVGESRAKPGACRRRI